MGMFVMGNWMGKGGCADIGNVLHCGGSGSAISRLESWVVYLGIGKALGGFHYQVIYKLMGQMTQRNRYGTWTYPSLEEEM